MKKKLLRAFRPHYFVILLVVTATIVMSGAQRISAAELKKSPYLIKVNRYYNTITIYEQEEGKEPVPVKAMTCSVGAYSRTITGAFPLKEKYRWKALMGNVWGQYSTRIVGGILFHSVYYYENGNPASLATAEFNKLGKAASHGCIRLTVADAKWIYDNCPSGTLVEIFDDKSSPGPLGKPETVKIDRTVRWDPTDPDERNPYVFRLPTISGVTDQTIPWGDKTLDVLKGITAKSASGKKLTANIKVEGEINPYVAGEYKITYSVEDELGQVKMKTAIFTVEECASSPSIIGVKDRIVAREDQINEEFALTDITAYCLDEKLDPKLIKVSIEQKSAEEYYITYKLSIGKNNKATEYATFYIDNLAPSLTGIVDKYITPGVVLSQEDVLTDITVSDNYSKLDINDIQVTLEQKEEGYYLVTYTVADEVGNTCSVWVKYYYQ
ncbi:MAG: Choline binding protein [Firmicutes bacterium]|nr:Choline binding protein [Bacillota bacterium]